MANRLTLAGGTDLVPGDDALSADWNDTLNAVLRHGVPIGGIVAWHKSFGEKESGASTSVVSTELNDSGANFTGTGVVAGDRVHMIDYTNTASLGPINNSTQTVSSTSFVSAGVYIDRVLVEANTTGGGGGNQNTIITYTYADTSTAVVTIGGIGSSGGFVTRTHNNPNPGKKVTNILFQIQTFNSTDNITGRNAQPFFLSNTTIASVDSATQLTLDEDLFNLVGINYKVSKTPVLPGWFAECDGSTLSDPDSEYDGETLPNLNGNQDVLQGNVNSGGTGTLSDSNTNVSTFEVVWIMRTR